MWVDVSPWAYPFLLTLHGLGMAVVVGLTVVISLRVLGFPAKVPMSAYQPLMPLLLSAFAVNFLSGVVLWTTDAQQLTFNLSYQIKMVSIILGCIALWRLNAVVLAPAARAGETEGGAFVMPAQGKLWAIVTVLIWWLAVIVSGRLVAYVSAAV